MKQKIEEVRRMLAVGKAQYEALLAERRAQRQDQLETEELERQKQFQEYQSYANTLIDSFMHSMSEIRVGEFTKAEAQSIFGTLHGDFDKNKVKQYWEQYRELMNKFRSKELAEPWETCDPDLFYEKLKTELDNEDSIAKAIGDPYVTLIKHLDRLKARIDYLSDASEDAYYSYNGSNLESLNREQGVYEKVFKETVENTVNLLFKKAITLDVYKAQSKTLEVSASPILRAIGLTMMGLAIGAVALGFLFPAIPAGVVIGAAIGASLAGCGFFYAARPDSFSKEAQDGLPKSMNDVAMAVSEIPLKPL